MALALKNRPPDLAVTFSCHRHKEKRTTWFLINLNSCSRRILFHLVTRTERIRFFHLLKVILAEAANRFGKNRIFAKHKTSYRSCCEALAHRHRRTVVSWSDFGYQAAWLVCRVKVSIVEILKSSTVVCSSTQEIKYYVFLEYPLMSRKTMFWLTCCRFVFL